MAQDFYTILTRAGLEYEANRKAQGLPIKLAVISVGDGGGAAYNPSEAQTALRREVWRGPLSILFQDEKTPRYLVAELSLPDDVGGFYVREVAIWTDTGILYAIGKYPESFKPLVASGAAKEFYIRVIFETSNASIVTMVADNAVMKATRAYVIDYVAEELSKLDGKVSVRAASTAAVVANGPRAVDGVNVVVGDRVLLKHQAIAAANGIYIVAAGAWYRAPDARTDAAVTPGLRVHVEEGTVNADTVWQLVTNGPVKLDTTDLTFEMLAGPTGVVAGTYRALTVDKYGRATAGSNPILPVAEGGTGANNQADARANLGAAPLESPEFTGDPRVPTQAVTDNDKSIANTEFVQLVRAALVDGAPAALNTLKKLATALDLKAPLASPSFTGVPTVPTPPLAVSSKQAVNAEFVLAAVAALVDSSPAALDTLNELAAAIGNDPNFATTMVNALAQKLSLSGGRMTGELRTVADIAVATNSYFRFNETDAGLGWGVTETSSDGFLRFRTRSGTGAWADRFYSDTAGILTATGFKGSGAGLTGLNASSLSLGVVPDACLSGTYSGVNITGNAGTATKLAAGKNIALTGSVVGDVTTDFAGNVSLATSIARISPTVDISATFRAAAFGGLSNGLRVIRSANGGLPNFPQYGPCLAWSTDDTHALLSVSYNLASARLSAGHGTGMNWTRELAFLDSPNFFGVPTVPTPPLAVSSKQVANAEFVLAAVAALVDSSPAALDTLKELAAALGNDPNFATTMTNALAQKLGVTGGTLTGPIFSAGGRDSGIYGVYSSTLVDHVWSMGGAYRVAADGSDFGTLYGMAYKHTNNPSGGNMAGGHQIVFCNAGVPGAAIGMAGNIWTSGTYYGDGSGLTGVPQAGVAGLVAALAAKAALASPAFTGVPTAPTQATADSSTRLATTAFVKNNLAAVPKNTAGLSAGSPNWWKCADTGLITQFGRYTGTGTGSPLTVTFPVAFPNECTSVVLGADNSSADHDLASLGRANFVTRTSSNIPVCWVAYGY